MTSRPPDGLLSPRQREVLGLMASGMTNLEVAAELGMSSSAVADHLAHAGRKLGSSERPGMVHAAYTRGELDPPERVLRVRAEVTSRERWILQGLADGRTLEEIAAGSGLYVRVVRADARALRARLRAKSTAHLITRAWQESLLGPESAQPAAETSGVSTGREKAL
ncbi:helix-turn-helix transcriptional regulator [Streptomyces sp. FXJ1.4098]|nr:helix-turn-helix transcriptional regulator [Streptomyces sp. FXJ1.4098]